MCTKWLCCLLMCAGLGVLAGCGGGVTAGDPPALQEPETLVWELVLRNASGGELALEFTPAASDEAYFEGPRVSEGGSVGASDGLGRATLPAGASLSATLFCFSRFFLRRGATEVRAGGYTPGESNCPRADGLPEVVNLTRARSWLLSLQNTGNPALVVRVDAATEVAFFSPEPPTGWNAAARTFPIAAGEVLNMRMLCGHSFTIVAGEVAAQVLPSPAGAEDTCGSESAALVPRTWRAALDNGGNPALELEFTFPEAIAGASIGGYVQGGSSLNVPADDGTQSVEVLCGRSFGLAAGQVQAVGPLSSPAGAEAASCGSQSIALALRTREVVLRNGAANPALKVEFAPASAAALRGVAGVPYIPGALEFSVPSAAAATLTLLCELPFAILAGEVMPAAAVAGCSGQELALAPRTWRLSLDNSGNPALELPFTAPEAIAASSISGYVPGAASLSVPADDGTQSVEVLCGRSSGFPAGQAQALGPLSSPAGTAAATCGSESATLVPRTWTLILDNSGNPALDMVVARATADAISATSDLSGYTVGDTVLSLPANSSATATLVCAHDFTIEPNGDVAAPLSTPAPTQEGSSCESGTARADIVPRTWTLILDNSGNPQLGLKVDQATRNAITATQNLASFDPSGRILVVNPGSSQGTVSLLCSLQAFLIETPGHVAAPLNTSQGSGCTNASAALIPRSWQLRLDNPTQAEVQFSVRAATAAAITTPTGNPTTLTVPPAGLLVSLNFCGSVFSFAALTQNDPVQNSNDVASLCDGTVAPVTLNVRTWQMRISRHTSGLPLAVSPALAAGGDYATLPIDLAIRGGSFSVAGGSAVITFDVLCNKRFEILAASGILAAQKTSYGISPVDCTSTSGSDSVTLQPPGNPVRDLSLPISSPSGSAGAQYNEIASGRVFAYTTNASGDSVALKVNEGLSELTSDTSQLGPRENAAISFDVTVGLSYNLTASANGTAQPNLELHIRPAEAVATGARSIAMGNNYSCFLLASGLSCVGEDTAGRLGGNSTPADQVILMRPAVFAGASAIAAGQQHACALIEGATASDTDDEALCWGNQHYGRLGNNSTGNAFQSSPVSVRTLQLPSTEVTLSGFTAIRAGREHTCAIISTEVFCWGRDDFGQVGDGSTTTSMTGIPSPVSGIAAGTATALDVGEVHSCAVVAAGVKCWGGADFHRLGNNDDSTNQHTPVDVEQNGGGLLGSVAGLSVGASHSCVLTANTQIFCWGLGDDGRLGRNSMADAPRASAVTDGSVALTGFTAVSAAALHTCAIRDDELGNTNSVRVWCWGSGSNGRLGNGGSIRSLVPAAVVNLPFVPARLSLGYNAQGSCAMSAQGRPGCWGKGEKGVLGNGEALSENALPVDVYDSSGF